MIIDVSARQSGKTTRIVEWLKKNQENGIIVVICESEKHRVMNEYGLSYQQVETYKTILDEYYPPVLRTKKLFLDNVDHFIKDQLGRYAEISGLSISGRNGFPKERPDFSREFPNETNY